NIVWQRETGKSLEDSGVLGSAIDTGALDYGDEITLMLITEGRVKFYPSRAGVLSAKNAYELTNEELLSSTGFTPYTESGTLAAVTARVGSADVPAEKYKDKNQVQVTQEKVAKALNSSRVGTIQAATSFTMLSDDEVLISAYDSGLTMLRLNDTHDILHLQGGSYYQSFPERGTGKYKVVGYDTEEYAYGSMDLARAKVYDFDLVNRRTEIYLMALQSHLDQLAVDYVRRLHRTRVEITQDKDGKTISQKTVTVAFEDDASEEAASERLLFGTAEGPAMEELRRQEQAAHISHTKEAEEYLRTLRGRVLDQQRALNEIFLLTRASTRPLIAGKLTTDPYWVGLMERVQAATDSGELKDILVEIATNEDMIRAMEQEAAAAADPDKKKALEADAETYRSFRETLDYKKEEEYQNETLTEVELDADSLTKMLDNRKTPKDFEEKYSEIIRNQGEEPDPLADTLKLDGIMNTDRKSNDPDRMRIRSLVLEDIENDYLKQHPVKPDKAFDPDGTYKEVVPIAKEDEAWENYLKDLLYRINPKNLAAARAVASEEFADLTWKSARTMENGTITSTSLSVDESVRTKMRQQMLDALNDCETISQVEALFFGTQIENLGNPYGSFRADYTSWENNTEGTEADRAKAMRASDWYKKLKNWLVSSPTVKTMLNAKSQSWEQYIQSVITHRTGRVLRDEETGEKVGSHTNASSVFAQLVEFLCEGAGEVDQETKIKMVEDLLIGMYNITGSQAAEEAVLIERMTLPAYSGYLAAYEAFNAKSFEPVARDSEQTDDAGTVSFRVSDEEAVRQLEYREQDFYKKLILSMRESGLVKAYLKSNNESWEQYMASLPVLAQNENITDPESSARKIYETFKPFRPLTKEDQPEASDGQEARPTFESMSGEGQMNDKGSING
ncbi:MAG: hypothetical protein K5696_11815, partial [Lachnospiraceae bacterium]|nr:hypothetical protein [Lachnospiraceae bacterium]